MKKIAIMVLIAVTVFMPFRTSFGDGPTLLDKFTGNDSVLAGYTEKYSNLVSDRSEDLEFYNNYRIRYGNIYYTAMGEAARDNGLSQVDWNIGNALYDIKARELSLAISFRNLYSGLYMKKLNVEDASLDLSEADVKYNESVSGHDMGYISDIELLQAEYDHMKSENSYNSALRSYESALRNFNDSLGNDLTYSDYDFDFNEETSGLMTMDEYIDSAVANSKDLSLLRQTIKTEETEINYLDKYVISPNLSYYRDEYNRVKTELERNRLELKAAEEKTRSDARNEYNDILVENDKLGLREIAYEKALNDYEVSKGLFDKGLLTDTEFDASERDMTRSRQDLMLAVYGYNTKVMTLEYDCACFMQGDDGQ